MKALVFDSKIEQWENSRGFAKVEIPAPRIDEKKNPQDKHAVLIKVYYAGVCGTDRGIWYRQAFREQILGSIEAENIPLPQSLPTRGREVRGEKVEENAGKSGIIPSPRGGGQGRGEKTYRIIGHEFFGEVVKVGSQVSRVKKGEFVSCESHVVCNQCFQCRRGQKNVCTNEKILGISHDGAFAEYIKVPEHIVWPTDLSKIRPEVAAMQEPFGNAVHAASKADLRGKTVAIFGLGPIGLFEVLVARGLGAKNIIGVEPNPKAIEMAKNLGIDYVIPLKVHPHPTSPLKGEENAGKSGIIPSPRGGGLGRGETEYWHNPEITDEIMKITGGLGVDVSFEMAGFNSSVNNAIFSTRRGGDVILFGIKNGDFVFENYNRLIVYGLTMHAVIGRQVWETWETTKKLLEDRSNKIQEKMFKVILQEGRGTIIHIDDYEKETFAKNFEEPKLLIEF